MKSRLSIGDWIIDVVLLFVVSFFLLSDLSHGQAQTSFEFTDLDGRFVIAECPACIVFENGEARTAENDKLALHGSNSWHVAPGRTGVVTFEVPARSLSFFYRDQDQAVDSLLTMFNSAGEVIVEIGGTPLDFITFNIQDGDVKRITLKNQAPVGEPRYAVLEDMIVAFHDRPEAATVDALYLPRFGDGTFTVAGKENTFLTEVQLLNTGNSARATLDIFDDNGDPMAMTLENLSTGNRATDTRFDLDLQPGESEGLTSVGLGAGSGGLVAGYWRIRVQRLDPNEPGQLGATGVFKRLQRENGNQVTLFETGIPAARALREFHILLDSIGDRDTGLALLNPLPLEDVGPANPVDVTLEVWDLRFENLLARVEFELNPGELVSKFVWEYVRDFSLAIPELLQELQETRAVVRVVGNLDIVAMTLRQDNPNAVFPEAVPALAAFPVVAK